MEGALRTCDSTETKVSSIAHSCLAIECRHIATEADHIYSFDGEDNAARFGAAGRRTDARCAYILLRTHLLRLHPLSAASSSLVCCVFIPCLLHVACLDVCAAFDDAEFPARYC
jgi:hypothetical protein